MLAFPLAVKEMIDQLNNDDKMKEQPKLKEIQEQVDKMNKLSSTTSFGS